MFCVQLFETLLQVGDVLTLDHHVGDEGADSPLKLRLLLECLKSFPYVLMGVVSLEITGFLKYFFAPVLHEEDRSRRSQTPIFGEARVHEFFCALGHGQGIDAVRFIVQNLLIE